MAALRLALIFTCLLGNLVVSYAYTYCRHGDIKNLCETHQGCDPGNMCHECECYQDAWDCSYNGYPDCATDFEYLDLGTYGNSRYIYSMREKRWNDAKKCLRSKRRTSCHSGNTKR